MPRYYGGNSALEQYGGTEFDPLTGRLNGGQLVMQVLNQIAALKEKKQQGEWDIEDRDMKKAIFDLQQQKYGQDVEQGKWEAQHRVDPKEKAKYEFVAERFGNIAQAQQREREIKLRGEEDRKTARLKDNTSAAIVKAQASRDSAYQKAKAAIESKYTADLDGIEKEYVDNAAKTRGSKQASEITKSTVPTPYLISMRGHLAAKNRRKKELELRRAAELEALEKIYESGGDMPGMSGETLTDFHVNPKTGERIGWNGKAWVVAK